MVEKSEKALLTTFISAEAFLQPSGSVIHATTEGTVTGSITVGKTAAEIIALAVDAATETVV